MLHLLHQHTHGLHEGSLRADLVVLVEVFKSEAGMVDSAGLEGGEGLPEGGEVGVEKEVAMLRPQLVTGGGHQEEGEVLGGRGYLGVLPVQHKALDSLALFLLEEDVLLPALAVDDGVEGCTDLPPHAGEHLRHS